MMGATVTQETMQQVGGKHRPVPPAGLRSAGRAPWPAPGVGKGQMFETAAIGMIDQRPPVGRVTIGDENDPPGGGLVLGEQVEDSPEGPDVGSPWRGTLAAPSVFKAPLLSLSGSPAPPMRRRVDVVDKPRPLTHDGGQSEGVVLRESEAFEMVHDGRLGEPGQVLQGDTGEQQRVAAQTCAASCNSRGRTTERSRQLAVCRARM